MALLNISAAARAAGKDRNTIKRYIKSGKLSATNDVQGNMVIDSAELMRVFGALASDGSTSAAGDAPAQSPENTSFHQAIDLLKHQLDEALKREEWFKGQLEKEQERSRQLEQLMLPQGTQEKKGFFKRLFG